MPLNEEITRYCDDPTIGKKLATLVLDSKVLDHILPTN